MTHPPFCPNRSCSHHIDPLTPQSLKLSRKRWFKRNGTYPTKLHGSVTRFKCLVCRRGFSEQTFSLDYFAKRTIDYRRLHELLVACAGVRAIARLLGCSPDSVTNRTSRLSRQCISANTRLLAATEIGEDQAADGFQSFAVSQYFPNNIHLLVGSHSQLVSFCDYASLRRSGRMTALQKRMRAAFDVLYPTPPDTIRVSFTLLLDHLHRRLRASTPRPLVLHTDRKLEYRRALASHVGLANQKGFTHQRTDSRAARVRANPLFPVNYLDRELRKDLAEHVRETVRFARNVNHSMERLWIYLHHHNMSKRYRVNDPVALERTHAEEAGAVERTRCDVVRWLYTRRRFLSFESLEPATSTVWRREHSTPLKGIVKGALRLIRRQAARGEVDLDAVREKLGVTKLVREVVQYLPKYALA